LVKDPVMKPFVEDLRRQMDERATGTRLGLSIDDLREVPGGELAVAAIQPGPGQAATAVIVDITGKRPRADEMLKRVAASMAKQGAKEHRTQAAGVMLIVYDLPAPEGHPAPETPHQSIYFIRENILVAADNAEVAQAILARLGGRSARSLADVAGFQAVMKRCAADAGKALPQVRWYVHPLGYIEVAQAAQAERGEKKRRKRSMLDVLKKQGFGALEAIGGYIDFSSEGHEIFHRTAIYAPPPYQGAMKILLFPNAAEFAPQRWVPRDLASYATFYTDVPNAFDNFGSLFDELYNDGEPGLWKEVIDGMRDDPNGPRVDLRKELISFLGPRVNILTDYQLPITTTSERLLIAVEAKDEKAVAAALAKLFKNDREMRKRAFPPEKPIHVIWESVPPEKAAVPPIDLSLPDIGQAPRPQKKEEAAERTILPNQALTVAHGHLMIASHYDFLIKVLKQSEERTSLGRAVEYQEVAKPLAAIAPKSRAAETFNRMDETLRPTYELIRQGKMPQSETMFGRVLNTALSTGKKGVTRKQRIEGTKMPDFDYVRRSLGPAGAYVVSEEQGWFIKGMMVGKR
jgi:hypothetical protein